MSAMRLWLDQQPAADTGVGLNETAVTARANAAGTTITLTGHSFRTFATFVFNTAERLDVPFIK
jgi:hypothetical protein